MTHESMEAYNIIPASEEDWPDIIRLLESVELPVDDLSSPLPFFWVARHNGQLAGCIGLEMNEKSALLRSLAVAKSAQRAGLGASLLQAACEAARSRKVKTIYLLTNTATSFFSRHGFTHTDRETAPQGIAQSSQFSAICPASADFMKLEIADRYIELQSKSEDQVSN